jgi:tight adherence protein B
VPNKAVRKDLDWAADLEMLASAMGAGLSNSESISLLSQRSSDSWRGAFELLNQKFEQRSNISVALAETKHAVADFRFDLLAELMVANNQLGGSGLVDSISRSAAGARLRAAANEDVQTRLRAVLAVTRLGVASPWLMALLLSTRRENLDAFVTGSGPLVIAFGATLTLVAWRIVVVIAKLPAPLRGLAT